MTGRDVESARQLIAMARNITAGGRPSVGDDGIRRPCFRFARRKSKFGETPKKASVRWRKGSQGWELVHTAEP